MNRKLWCTISLVLVYGLLTGANEKSIQDKNKQTVKEFYDLAFNQHQPLEAANKYLAVEYKQHNPTVADGKNGFIAAFGSESKKDKSMVEFKRFIAEDDIVVVHSWGHRSQNDQGVALVDIFRIKENKIVEHWDVIQPIPEKSMNNNTMF